MKGESRNCAVCAAPFVLGSRQDAKLYCSKSCHRVHINAGREAERRAAGKKTHRVFRGDEKFRTAPGSNLVFVRVCERDERRREMWICKCLCGNEARVLASSARSGNTRSCGCLHSEAARVNRKTHGHTSKRGGQSPTYHSWSQMKHRCADPERKSYGARGITVCERWQSSFENFLADMGPAPLGMSIDRIDNNGNYEPGNCRWATDATQTRNRTITKLNEVSASLIRYMRRRGESVKGLANAFGVSGSQIKRVVARELWK